MPAPQCLHGSGSSSSAAGANEADLTILGRALRGSEPRGGETTAGPRTSMISGTSSHDPVDCSRSGVDKEVAATRLAPLSGATTMATLGGVSSLRKSPRSARTTEFNHSSYGCGSPGILSTLCQDLMPQQTWALVVTKTRIYIYIYINICIYLLAQLGKTITVIDRCPPEPPFEYGTR